ncbi:MAG: hypothetical protein WC732_03040 [Candidatus Omnitrophota bacterium]
MEEESKQENSPGSPHGEPDVAALIRKIQQQLTFLEKKIDILINQSQAEPSREKYFSKPYRPFDRPARHGKAEGREGYRERGPGQGRNYEKPQGGENRGFGYKKKSYDHPREDFGHERRFDKPHGGESRGFSHKKKAPFYFKRKDRG